MCEKLVYNTKIKDDMKFVISFIIPNRKNARFIYTKLDDITHAMGVINYGN